MEGDKNEYMDPKQICNNVGQGSTTNVQRSFQSIVYPDKDAIEIPSSFLDVWKDTICAKPDACLKDPANNFFHFDTRTTLVSNCIHSGLTIARYCGFEDPQRVVFEYLPQFNQFNMSFVDDHGVEINFQTISSQYIWSNPGGNRVPWIPAQFLLIDSDNDDCGRDVTPKKDSSADDDALEFTFHWEEVVSQAFAQEPCVLQFPSFICNACPDFEGRGLIVFNEKINDDVACIVKKSNATKREFHIEGGWYDFAKKLGLRENDKMMFSMNNPATILRITIVKSEVL